MQIKLVTINYENDEEYPDIYFDSFEELEEYLGEHEGYTSSVVVVSP